MPRTTIAAALSITLGIMLLAPCRLSLAREPESVSAGLSMRQEQQGSPFEIRWSLDLPLTLTGLWVSLAPEILAMPASGLGGLQLDGRGVNALDRNAIGNRSASAGLTSDVLLAGSLILPHVLNLADATISGAPDGLAGVAKDSLVLLETYAVNAMVCNLIKFAVRRPRPYMYDSSTGVEEAAETTSTLSFFSGHTSAAFSMATAYSYLFSLRHPNSPYRLPVWIGAHALASTTAVMRVQAGKHFWSDVLAGAAVGSAVGFLVPHLHRKTIRLWDKLPLLAEVRVMPAFHQGGFGVNIFAFW